MGCKIADCEETEGTGLPMIFTLIFNSHCSSIQISWVKSDIDFCTRLDFLCSTKATRDYWRLNPINQSSVGMRQYGAVFPGVAETSPWVYWNNLGEVTITSSATRDLLA